MEGPSGLGKKVPCWESGELVGGLNLALGLGLRGHITSPGLSFLVCRHSTASHLCGPWAQATALKAHPQSRCIKVV